MLSGCSDKRFQPDVLGGSTSMQRMHAARSGSQPRHPCVLEPLPDRLR
jgi:hypothetical protein